MLSDKKYGLSVNIMATRVMPSLLPQTVNPSLNLEQFTMLLEVSGPFFFFFLRIIIIVWNPTDHKCYVHRTSSPKIKSTHLRCAVCTTSYYTIVVWRRLWVPRPVQQMWYYWIREWNVWTMNVQTFNCTLCPCGEGCGIFVTIKLNPFYGWIFSSFFSLSLWRLRTFTYASSTQQGRRRFHFSLCRLSSSCWCRATHQICNSKIIQRNFLVLFWRRCSSTYNSIRNLHFGGNSRRRHRRHCRHHVLTRTFFIKVISACVAFRLCQRLRCISLWHRTRLATQRHVAIYILCFSKEK